VGTSSTTGVGGVGSNVIVGFKEGGSVGVYVGDQVGAAVGVKDGWKVGARLPNKIKNGKQ